MSDDPAFIRTIAANPDDDAPRLVYADYLEETGDPAKMARADFIRVQVEKARLVPDTPRWTELWHRDTALLDWAREWRAELPRMNGLQYGGFVRGFIERVEGNDEALIGAFPIVLEAVPATRVTIWGGSQGLANELLTALAGAKIANVRLTSMAFSPFQFLEFATGAAWPELREVHIPGAFVTTRTLPADWEAFATTSTWESWQTYRRRIKLG